MVSYVKNKDFTILNYSVWRHCYQSKSSPQVHLVIPPVVNRFISVRELRAVSIKHMVKLSL